MYKYYSEPREKYHDRIMELYFKEGVSVTALTEKFPVSNRTISRWIRIFANENNLGLHRMVRKIKAVQNLQINKKDIKQPEKSEKQGIPDDSQNNGDDVEQLKTEIRRLKRQLEDEQLRSKLYEKMIEITEQELNISITKKAGAKR